MIFWKGGLYAFITWHRCELLGRFRGMLPRKSFWFYPLKCHFLHSRDSKSICEVKIINSGVYQVNSQPENQNFLYSLFLGILVIINILTTLEHVFSENVSFIFSLLDRDITFVNIYLYIRVLIRPKGWVIKRMSWEMEKLPRLIETNLQRSSYHIIQAREIS